MLCKFKKLRSFLNYSAEFGGGDWICTSDYRVSRRLFYGKYVSFFDQGTTTRMTGIVACFPKGTCDFLPRKQALSPTELHPHWESRRGLHPLLSD
jgi:hypothetical protein